VAQGPKGARPPLSLSQVASLFAVILVLVLVIDFSQRLATSQRLVDSANQVETEVAFLRTEQAALKTQIAYATTDPAVIAWAHEQGKMVRPGEVLVVPILPTAQPTPPTLPVTVLPQTPNWVLWWNLFFTPVRP
jgi:cell division protein FtsB